MPAVPTVRECPRPDALARARRLYREDGYTWAMEQAEALRRRDFGSVDWENVIEEVEDMGRRHYDSWESLCARAVEHMLAIEHWEAADSGTLETWAHEIGNFREQMKDVVRKHPGLQGSYAELFDGAWKAGRDMGVDKLVGLDCPGALANARRAAKRRWDQALPEECPYLLEEVAAFDLKRDRFVRDHVMPPGVARVLNERAGLDYPVKSRSRMEPRLQRWQGPSR